VSLHRASPGHQPPQPTSSQPRCNPFDLTISNAHLQRGFNKIYDWNLAASLRRIFAGHVELWRNAKAPMRPDLVAGAKTIRAFDEAITVHSFGGLDGLFGRVWGVVGLH